MTPQASGHRPPVPHPWLHTCQCPAAFLPRLAAAHAGRVGASAGAQAEEWRWKVPRGVPLLPSTVRARGILSFLQDFPVLLPFQFRCRSRFIKEENDDEGSIGFPAGWVWEASNVFPQAPHLRCFVSSSLHISAGLLSCWSLLHLQELSSYHSSFLVQQSSSQLISPSCPRFIAGSCVCLSRSWLPSSVRCSFAELWVKL